MSRQRTRIETALRLKGYAPVILEWESPRAGAEKSGLDGGWYVRFESLAPAPGLLGGEEVILGLNIEEVLSDIARLAAVVATAVNCDE